MKNKILLQRIFAMVPNKLAQLGGLFLALIFLAPNYNNMTGNNRVNSRYLSEKNSIDFFVPNGWFMDNKFISVPSLLDDMNSGTIKIQSTPSPYILHEYIPTDWELIDGSEQFAYHETIINTNGIFWIVYKDVLTYFDGKEWGTEIINGFTNETLSIKASNPDGTLWLEGRGKDNSVIIQVKDKKSIITEVPFGNEHTGLSIASDRKNGAWVLLLEGFQVPQKLFHFDGKNWKEYPLPDIYMDSGHIYTDDLGNLWLNSNMEFSRFDGKKWKVFDIDSSTKDRANQPETRILLTPGTNGSIWVVKGYSRLTSVFHNYLPDGRIENIYQNFLGTYVGQYMSMMVDKDNHLWLSFMGAPDANTPVIFWDGNNWNTFTNLPFKIAHTIIQKDKKMFIQTEKGWYLYTPK